MEKILMPKKAYLATHFPPHELKQKYRTAKDPVEAKRWGLIWKISLGWTIKNSAIALGIHYQYAKKIVKSYNDLGAEGLKNKKQNSITHRRGKPPLLNPQQYEHLIALLQERPADGGIWTGVKVARWIETETQREKVSNQRGWEYLKKCGYTWQRPRPKHRKGEVELQREFKENLPIKVKELEQRYPQAKIEVWFFDEHRLGLKPIVRKVWSKRGERPIAQVEHRYEWLYVYGFVEPKTGKTQWYLIPSVNIQWMNLVLKTFAAEEGVGEEKIILLVQDRAGWHRSGKVEVPQGIISEFLPPYSPELQPAERLWLMVDEPLVNQYIGSIEELEEIVANRCCVLQEKREEIKSLTNYHWLSYG
jgi:transposase